MPRKADDREAPESSKNLLQMAKLPLIWVREPEIEFYFDSFFFVSGKRDFVDHINHTDPIDGLVLIDKEYCDR